MKRVEYRPGLIIAALLVVACAPTTPQARPGAPGTEPTAAAAQRMLVMVVPVEPPFITRFKSFGQSGAGSALRLFDAGLVLRDPRGEAIPYLAEALPDLSKGTWRVFPDGQMETTFRLRPGLTWHDGTPLTADDFVLTWQVASTTAFGVSDRQPYTLIESVAAQDAGSVLVRWSRPYVSANQLREGDYAALPRHILGGSFEQLPPDTFLNLAYWSHEYVGLGPYRLDRWERGAYIEARAFEGHALGKPKIERIRVTFVSDPNTVATYLLAGEAHVAVDRTVGFEQGQLLKREWVSRAAGNVLVFPADARYLNVQFRQDYVNPKALLDLRVRKALMQTMDRAGLVEGLLAGDSTVADTLIGPNLSTYGAVDRVLTKYGFDPTRAKQLMIEAGFEAGSDGFYTGPGGDRFSLELRGLNSGQEAKENSVLVDGWRRAGFDSSTRLLSAAEERERDSTRAYPGLLQNRHSLDDLESTLIRLHSSLIGMPANRWSGANRGGWSSPEYDRLFDTYVSTLERGSGEQAAVQALKLLSEELPVFPLYYNVEVMPTAAGLTGPDPTGGEAGNDWNIYAWEWR